MKKNILIIITIIFLTTLLGVFVLGSEVRAAQVCPDPCTPKSGSPNPNTTGDTKYIRMQVYIPGVTDTCTYKVDGKDKKCYYIKSDLPAYIKQLYSFTIGAIAIIAVIMIMIGGLEWIFAAGNPTRIGAARQQITAAVAGLILALCSYVLLNAINPSLTKLTMTVPGAIETIEQGVQWCADFPKEYKSGMNYIFAEEGSWGKPGTVYIGPGASGYTFQCGYKYQFGYQAGTKKIELGKGQTCIGNYCGDEDRVCYTEASYSFCQDPKELCEDKTNKDLCSELNNKLYASNAQSSVLNYSCFKRNDKWWSGGGLEGADECKWGKIIMCPGEWERVDCLTGPEADKDKVGGCWQITKGKKRNPVKHTVNAGTVKVDQFCENNPYVNENTALICCMKKDGDKQTYQAFGAYIASKAVTIDCKDALVCSIYNTSKEACERNICKIPGNCKWQSGTCVAQ